MGPPLKLLDDSSDEELDAEFTINKSYANSYSVWRNKEELQKLKDLSKEISSSSSESEEEEPKIEKDFLKTLSLLKSKDPRIYDEKAEFFKEEDVPKKPKVKKEKPMFMKDYERKIVLEQNGMFVDEDDDDDNEHLHQRPLLTNKEEEKIKKSFQEAAPDSEEEEDLFQVRTKTKAEEEKEDADYKHWLETEKDMLFLNKCWNDPKISEDERFLRDYILNKRYLTDDKPGEIPMYDEITQDIDLLHEDEKDLEKQETFEHKYNFRFEEPDEEFIKSYPRTVGDSLRRENNKRKQKREEYAERKKKEREQKREELKRLKALKRKEIEEKFLKLKEASGQDQLNFDESDIESDFDPDKHDRKMKEMFDDDYYNVEEEQKPEFEFDEEIDNENWDRWTRDQMNHAQNAVDKISENTDEGSSEEEEEDSKDDLRLQFEQEMIDSTTSNKNKRGRKKSLFAKILSQPKPLYDPSGKSFEDYVDEYYKLDYEDIIGDMPVRFKYRRVVPNDFGLTVDEILAAQDKELNRWCSVKKTCQYRDDKDEIYDVQAFKKKAQNLETKKKILTSVYTPPEEEKIPQANTDNSNEVAPKRKKKRSKKKKNTQNPGVEEGVSSVQNNGLSSDNTGPNTHPESSAEVSNQSKRKKKKKKKSLTNIQEVNSRPDLNENQLNEERQQITFVQEPDHEHAGTEINQKLVISSKKRNKSKTLGKKDSVPNSESYFESDEMNESIVKNNTKKKRKKSQSVEGNVSIVESQSELEMNENIISKKKKRKLESSEKESSSNFAEYNEDDDAETENSQIVLKKKKLESVDGTDLSSGKQPKSRKNDSSFNMHNTTKSIYAESSVEIDSNRKQKKKKKNNPQTFSSQPSQKQKFYSQKFQFNKKQTDNDSVQIVDNSGKKIISSNTRLSAFEINPKKFKNRMIYGKNQT